jgi:hypothetical protein
MPEPTVESKTEWGKLFKGIGSEILKDVRTAAAVCVGVVLAAYLGTRITTPDAPQS